MRILAALALLLLIPAVAAETHTVQTVATGDPDKPFAFSPETIMIAVGDTVRWVNTDGTYHTTTSVDGVWDGVLASRDESYEHTFTAAGTFAYRCNPHATFMTGDVVVEEAMAPGEDSPGFGIIPLVAVVAFMALARR